jgi:hypothetical protein
MPKQGLMVKLIWKALICGDALDIKPSTRSFIRIVSTMGLTNINPMLIISPQR